MRHLREALAVALLVLGGARGGAGGRPLGPLRAGDAARRDLPLSRFPAVLALVVALGALLLVVAVLVQAARAEPDAA